MKNADDEFNARKVPLLAAISERVSDTDQMLSIARTDPVTFKSLFEKSKGANVHASRRSMRRVMAR